MAVRERFIAADSDPARKTDLVQESQEAVHASKRWQTQAFCEQFAIGEVAVPLAIIDAWSVAMEPMIGHNARPGATNCRIRDIQISGKTKVAAPDQP
jgi:hypothetical protein